MGDGAGLLEGDIECLHFCFCTGKIPSSGLNLLYLKFKVALPCPQIHGSLQLGLPNNLPGCCVRVRYPK